MTIAEFDERRREDLEARVQELVEQLRVALLRVELARQATSRAWRTCWPAAVVTSRGAVR